MLLRFVLFVFCAVLTASEQPGLTIEKLKAFVTSAIKMKYPDKQVADYLHKVKLTNQLDDRTVEELQGLGAGPKTVTALHELRDASANLPPPPEVQPVTPPKLPDPPDSIEQKRVLGEVTDYAVNYTSRLPDFICTQVTRRYIDPTGLEFWRSQDTIQERLSYFEGHEDYKVVLVNNQAVGDLAHEKLGGTTSAGEFGSMMKEIFDPYTQTSFEWERWATLRGHRMHVFSYRVTTARSKYSILAQGSERIIVGYHGSIFVDRDSNMIMKITMEADDIPPGYPVRQVRLSLDYDHVSISDHDFVLPLKAVVMSRMNAKFLTKNDVEFRMYRKFSAESTITAIDVQAPEPLPADATKEQPAKPESKKK